MHSSRRLSAAPQAVVLVGLICGQDLKLLKQLERGAVMRGGRQEKSSLWSLRWLISRPGKVFIHYVLPSAISGAYYWESMGGKNIFTPWCGLIRSFRGLPVHLHVQMYCNLLMIVSLDSYTVDQDLLCSLSVWESKCVCVFPDASAPVLGATVLSGGWRQQLLYEWTCICVCVRVFVCKPLGKT